MKLSTAPRSLFAPVGAFAAALMILPTQPSGLTAEYTAGLGLLCEWTSSTELELTSFERTIDGEPVESERDRTGQKTSETCAVAYDSTFSKVTDDGAPSAEQRSYYDGMQSVTFSMGDEEREMESESPFVGITLELRDSGDGLEIEVLEGDEPEDAALLDPERFRMRTILDGLLPKSSEELEAGAEWSLDSEAIQIALGLRDAGLLFPPAPRGEGGERGEGRRGGRGGRGGARGGPSQLLAQAEWTGTAKLAEIDDEGIATIELELECSGDMPERGGPGGRGPRGGGRSLNATVALPSPLVAGTFQARLEGQLRFDTAAKLPIGLSVEGSFSTEQTREFDRGESSMSMSSSQEGRFEQRVRISTVEDHNETEDQADGE